MLEVEHKELLYLAFVCENCQFHPIVKSRERLWWKKDKCTGLGFGKDAVAMGMIKNVLVTHYGRVAPSKALILQNGEKRARWSAAPENNRSAS
jgi:hypothetical protein